MNYADLEAAYNKARFGSELPDCAMMSKKAVIYFYRSSNPDSLDTDEQIIERLRNNELVVSLDSGVFIICKDTETALSVRATWYE